MIANGNEIATFELNTFGVFGVIVKETMEQIEDVKTLDEADNSHNDTVSEPSIAYTVPATIPATIPATEQIQNLLQVLNGEMDRNELQKKLNLSNKAYFLSHYLQPAIEQGFVAVKFPRSPNHPKQRYYLTQKGMSFLVNFHHKEKGRNLDSKM